MINLIQKIVTKQSRMSIQKLKNKLYQSERNKCTNKTILNQLKKFPSKRKKLSQSQILTIRLKLFAILLNKQKLAMINHPQMKNMKAQKSTKFKKNQSRKRLVNISPYGRKIEKQIRVISKKQIRRMKMKNRKLMILQTIIKNNQYLQQKLELPSQIHLMLNSLKVIQKRKKNRHKLRKYQSLKNQMNL